MCGVEKAVPSRGGRGGCPVLNYALNDRTHAHRKRARRSERAIQLVRVYGTAQSMRYAAFDMYYVPDLYPRPQATPNFFNVARLNMLGVAWGRGYSCTMQHKIM